MRGDGSVRKTNRYFSLLTELQMKSLREACLLSRRQEAVMELYFIKRQDINFVSDTLGISRRTTEREIARIREKTMNVLEEKGYV